MLIADKRSGLILLAVLTYAAAISTTVTVAPGVEMPRINLGTCCGSKPSVGLAPWLSAGGVGIDTAYDYGDQQDIASVLKQSGAKREDFFITTKVPAGIGVNTYESQCAADPQVALWYVQQDLAQLGVDYVDLVLLHGPCQLGSAVKDPDKANNALWSGLEAAKASGVTRSIGVSNYGIAELKALEGTVPAPGHDDETIAYCQAHDITYESYGAYRLSWRQPSMCGTGALKGCPHEDPRLQAMASAHRVSWSSICLRWILQRGAIVVTGTGANASSVLGYAHADLTEPFSFELTNAEMETLNKMQDE